MASGIDSAAKVATLRAMSDPQKSRLDEVRVALIGLHKALVDAERTSYEKTVGDIESPTHFLHLLTNDPWFAWLQPLSRFIVSLDERLEAEEPLTAGHVDTLVKETRTLLTPSEDGQDFARHYFDAMQADADVVIAHADLMQLLGRARKGPESGV